MCRGYFFHRPMYLYLLMGPVNRYIFEVQETLMLILRQPVDKEMLHRFRVQVKKMKAIWAIHPIGNGIAFSRSFPNISKLYSLAAFVRDKQMVLTCLELLHAFSQYPELKKNIQSRTKKHQKKFIEKLKLRHTKFGVSEENRLFSAYFKVASGTLIRQNRIAFRNLTINMLSLEKGKNPDELHKLRRQCKYLLFQCDAFHTVDSHKETGLTKQSLDHLQNQLGTWHDWWNTLEWLNNLKTKEKKTLPLTSLRSKAAKKEELLRREVLKDIQTILHGINIQPAI